MHAVQVVIARKALKLFYFWFSLVSCLNLSIHQFRQKKILDFPLTIRGIAEYSHQKMVFVRNRCVCHSDSTQNPTHLLRLRSLTFGVYFNSVTIYSLNSFHFILFGDFIYRVFLSLTRCCRIAIWSKNVCLRVEETTSHASYTSKFDNLSSELLLQPHDI